jgi:hypothetical protein
MKSIPLPYVTYISLSLSRDVLAGDILELSFMVYSTTS